MPQPPRLCPSSPLHPLPGTFPGCPGETWARLPSQSARRRPAPDEATPSSSSRSATASSFPTPPAPSYHLPQTAVVHVSLAFRFLQRKHLPCCVCWRDLGPEFGRLPPPNRARASPYALGKSLRLSGPMCPGLHLRDLKCTPHVALNVIIIRDTSTPGTFLCVQGTESAHRAPVMPLWSLLPVKELHGLKF